MTSSLTLVLLTCALAPQQRTTYWHLAPRIGAGQELVYRGSYTEEALGKGVQGSRCFRVDTRIFVLEADAKNIDVALYTQLRVKGAPGGQDCVAMQANASARLDCFQLNPQGRITQGTLPALWRIGPAAVETGCFVEVPKFAVGVGKTWEVHHDGQPIMTWETVDTEAVVGVPCLKLSGTQQSEEWSQPRADREAWRRTDQVWISTRDGLVMRVERTVEQRAPARTDPSLRCVTRYELESSLIYPGRLSEDRRREIDQCRRFQEQAEPLLKDVRRYAPAVYDALLAKIVYHLDRHSPTPYRSAILQLKRTLELAKKGESPTTTDVEPEPLIPHAKVGESAPDFLVGTFAGEDLVRLKRMLGQPLILVFYQPESAITPEILRWTQRLMDQHSPTVQFLGLAMSDDAQAVEAARLETGIVYPVARGRGLRMTYAVDCTPILYLIDGAGVVRGKYVGWGKESPDQLVQDLEALLPR